MSFVSCSSKLTKPKEGRWNVSSRVVESEARVGGGRLVGLNPEPVKSDAVSGWIMSELS